MSDSILNLLSVSLSGGVLALIIFALKPVLGKSLSKAFSYYVWLLVLIRLILPFGLSIELLKPVPEEPAAIVGSGAGYSVPSMPEDTAPQAALPEYSAKTSSVGNAESAESLPVTTDASADFKPFEWIYNHLTAIWLLGAGVSVMWYAFSYAVFVRRIKGSFAEPQKRDVEIFKELWDGGRVRFVCSSATETPMMIGVFKPTVVLPQLSYAENGMERELRNILRHELTHCRRWDTLYKWFAVLVNSVHWFNPVVYLVRRELGRACELSCDEAVIGGMDEAERRSYGNTLLAMSARKRIPASVVATTLSEEKRELKRRIVSIVDYKKKPKSAVALMCVLALILTGCASTVLSLTPKADEESEIINPDSIVFDIIPEFNSEECKIYAMWTPSLFAEQFDDAGEVFWSIGSSKIIGTCNAVPYTESETEQFKSIIMSLSSEDYVLTDEVTRYGELVNLSHADAVFSDGSVCGIYVGQKRGSDDPLVPDDPSAAYIVFFVYGKDENDQLTMEEIIYKGEYKEEFETLSELDSSIKQDYKTMDFENALIITNLETDNEYTGARSANIELRNLIEGVRLTGVEAENVSRDGFGYMVTIDDVPIYIDAEDYQNVRVMVGDGDDAKIYACENPAVSMQIWLDLVPAGNALSNIDEPTESSNTVSGLVTSIDGDSVFYSSGDQVLDYPEDIMAKIYSGEMAMPGVHQFGKSMLCGVNLLYDYLPEQQELIRSALSAIDAGTMETIDKETYTDSLSLVQGMFAVYIGNGDGTSYYLDLCRYEDKSKILLRVRDYANGTLEYFVGDYDGEVYDSLLETNMEQECRSSSEPSFNTAYYTLAGRDGVISQPRWINTVIVNLIDGPVAGDRRSEMQDADFNDHDVSVQICGEEYLIKLDEELVYYNGTVYELKESYGDYLSQWFWYGVSR